MGGSGFAVGAGASVGVGTGSEDSWDLMTSASVSGLTSGFN